MLVFDMHILRLQVLYYHSCVFFLTMFIRFDALGKCNVLLDGWWLCNCWWHREMDSFKKAHLLFTANFQGNRLFKEGKFQLAKAKYEKACANSS